MTMATKTKSGPKSYSKLVPTLPSSNDGNAGAARENAVPSFKELVNMLTTSMKPKGKGDVAQ